MNNKLVVVTDLGSFKAYKLEADSLHSTPRLELIEEFNQGYLQPTQSYAQQLFGEMTDRYYSLNALALATVEEDPLVGHVLIQDPEPSGAFRDQEQVSRLAQRPQLRQRRWGAARLGCPKSSSCSPTTT